MSLRSVGNYLKRWEISVTFMAKDLPVCENSRLCRFMENTYLTIYKRIRPENSKIYWCNEMDVFYRQKHQYSHSSKISCSDSKKNRLRLLSITSNRKEAYFLIFKEVAIQRTWIEMMSRLIQNSSKKVFLIVGNGKIFQGSLVRSWLEKHRSQIEVFIW